MYKIVATWSAPPADQIEEFEKHYADVHVPRASAVPHLRRIVLTRTVDGLPGGEPEFYRLAEMFWTGRRAIAHRLVEASPDPLFALAAALERARERYAKWRAR